MGTAGRTNVIAPLGREWARYAHLALPLIFLVAMLLYFPFWERFEFDQDEGGEAMRAWMTSRGYPLYSQVWSDEPPLFTYLLAGVFRIAGPYIEAGRVVVILFSAALIAAAAHILRKGWGGWHALAGAFLLFVLPYYTDLSAAAMVGLPAISLAVISLACLEEWRAGRRQAWLVASALALGFSALTKVFTGFLAPVFALGILLEGRSLPGRDYLRPALVWSSAFAGLLLVGLLFLVGPAHLDQLYTTHLDARLLDDYLASADQPIGVHLQGAWPVLLLSALGMVFVILRRRWSSLYLPVWSVAAFGLLTLHKPVFFHHQLLVSVPAAMLAGIAGGEGLSLIASLLRRHRLLPLQAGLALLGLAGFIAALALLLPATLANFKPRPVFLTGIAHTPWAEQMFLTRMSNHASRTSWVVTNLPIYAFRAGLMVPPELAFVSEKRMSTGELTEADLITAVRTYQPEQVLIGRREFTELKRYLQADYRLLYERGKRYLYLRNDLKGQ